MHTVEIACLRDMMHTADNFVIEYLGEIEKEFKYALVMGSNHEKSALRQTL